MLLGSLDAGGRIVDPAGVLARVADFGGEFRILLHPLFPVGVEIGAEDLCGFGLRGRGRLRLGEGEKRNSQKYSGKTSKGENADHVCLLADLDNSLSRSRASMTMTRAVSSMPIAVLSTRMASRARTSERLCAPCRACRVRELRPGPVRGSGLLLFPCALSSGVRRGLRVKRRGRPSARHGGKRPCRCRGPP